MANTTDQDTRDMGGIHSRFGLPWERTEEHALITLGYGLIDEFGTYYAGGAREKLAAFTEAVGRVGESDDHAAAADFRLNGSVGQGSTRTAKIEASAQGASLIAERDKDPQAFDVKGRIYLGRVLAGDLVSDIQIDVNRQILADSTCPTCFQVRAVDGSCRCDS